jgi:ergothioneine biosynthesis protein EgtB
MQIFFAVQFSNRMSYNGLEICCGVPVSANLKLENESQLAALYLSVRNQTMALCAPLEIEDYQIQPMDDASPPKWHLAHVTWFFETFILKPFSNNYRVFDPTFEILFNSYYNGVGKPFRRANRGFLSRPTLALVLEYRHYVDEKMFELIQTSMVDEILFRLYLGLNHEQQHQELILTDIKYNLGNNPLKPAYVDQKAEDSLEFNSGWVDYDGGLAESGTDAGQEFVFDNETPRHQVFLHPYRLSTKLVSNGEFIDFIEDGGYERPELWLSDGWAGLQAQQDQRWRMPLYWRKEDDTYYEYRLTGEHLTDPNRPVCHVSAYEADAYARWKGCRLPTEHEWEHAALDAPVEGNFVESKLFHPSGQSNEGMQGLFGNVWEWTQSGYGAYPSFKPFDGALGEYNGKFMANQLVLRGGSCASPRSHIRPTYRNFFYPPARWQFSGIRLAQDLASKESL